MANIFIAVIVYRRGPTFRLNRLFALTTGTIIAWNLNLFSLHFFTSASRAQFWSDIFRTGTLLMPPSIVHLFLAFGERESRPWRLYLASGYAVAGGLVVANLAGWLVSGLRQIHLGYYPIATPLYAVHVLSVVANFAVAAYLLITNVTRAASPHKRLQAKFWLLGAGIGIAGGTVNLLPVYHVHIYPIGSVANVAYTAIVSYAIVRHRLVDIDLVFSRVVGYGAVAVGVILPAFLAAVALQRMSFGRVDRGFSVALLLILVGVGLAFQAFRYWTELRVTRSFFGEKERQRVALRKFTRGIVRILQKDKIVSELGRVLIDALNTSGAVIFLRAERGEVLTESYRAGVVAPCGAQVLPGEFVDFLKESGCAILREEVRGENVRVFEKNEWDACVPILLNSTLLGCFGLVGQLDRQGYTSGDLELLDMVAAETAIALENARLYEALRRSQEVVRRAERLSALGTLAAGIAHEIRNPLVSIQTFLQLAPERMNDEGFMSEFLKLSEAEVRRIADLISDLLSLARSSDRSVQEVDLNDSVGAVVRLLAGQARSRGVEVEWQNRAGGARVWVDPDQLRQVLMNLVLNAIEASSSGGRVTVVTRWVRVGAVGFWQVEVKDEGPGVPLDLQEEIFTPFFTTKVSGTGLGLAIAHQIAAENGGFISLESEEGQGSRFLLHLPVVEREVADNEETAVERMGAAE